MDSKDMKKEIEEFKQNNGNSNFTQKDMIMYLVAKVDKIDQKISEGSGKIARNRQAIKDLQKLLYGTISALGAAVIALFNKLWR